MCVCAQHHLGLVAILGRGGRGSNMLAVSICKGTPGYGPTPYLPADKTSYGTRTAGIDA